MQGHDELIGTLAAGRYRLVERLGHGGMGNVYLAIHEAIEKRIALKVLRLEFSIKPDLVTRFQQEAISASRIKHPGVLDVFDFGRLDNGCFFIAMELLEGHDLADELKRRHSLDPPRAVRLALQICRALGAAHSQGVVHRDLKPENVFLHVTPDGDELVKIVDFGIAQLRSTEELAEQQTERRRLTRTGMIFGTPEYMSPEQAIGKHIDQRSDVYAAGIILYEMLTGAVPFTGDTFFGVLHAHMNNPLPALRSTFPELRPSPELEAVVTRALAKNPDERYPSMQELVSELSKTPEASLAPAAPVIVRPERSTVAQFADTQPQRDSLARAETQIGVERSDREPRRTPAWAKAVLALLALTGAAGAAALIIGARAESDVPASAAASASAPPAPIVTPSAEPSASAATPSSAEPERQVKLSVESVPTGAVVLKDGYQVCDRTPCELSVAADVPLELEAKKGALRGTSKVLAQRDQTVRITLAGPTGAPPERPRDCWTTIETPDGLKVPKRIPCR